MVLLVGLVLFTLLILALQVVGVEVLAQQQEQQVLVEQEVLEPQEETIYGKQVLM
jgi:hypothetical protein